MISTMESLYSDNYSLSSVENVKKVLRDVMQKGHQDYFLVFKERNLMGILSLRNLVRHSSDIQEEEIRHGREMQDFLLSENLIDGNTFSLRTTSQRAHDLGSDYYYSTELSPGLAMICCFEVQGGIQGASLVSVMIDTYLKTRKMTGSLETDKPENLMLSLNSYLFQHTPGDCPVRCIFLFIDSETEKTQHQQLRLYKHLFLIMLEEGKDQSQDAFCQFSTPGDRRACYLPGETEVCLSEGFEACLSVLRRTGKLC